MSMRAVNFYYSVARLQLLAAGVETHLADAGNLDDLHDLLANTKMALRIAYSANVLPAFTNSPTARDAIFKLADQNNFIAAKQFVDLDVSMDTITSSIPTLNVIGNNSTSWSLITLSQWYSKYVKRIIENLSGLDNSTYADLEALVTSSSAVEQIVNPTYVALAMPAVIASGEAVSYLVTDLPSMDYVAQSDAATAILANSDHMGTVANSANAMTKLTGFAGSMSVLSNSASAMLSISSVSAAFSAYLGSAFLAANLKNAVVNIAGLTGSYATITDIVVDTAALSIVANNSAAAQALSNSSEASAALADSANTASLAIVLNSAVAMEFFGSVANIDSFMDSSKEIVFASSLAKGVVVASTQLVDKIESTDAIYNYLLALSNTAIPASLRSATTAADDPFDGIPSKVVVLQMRANNIGAINANYDFDGSPAAGTGATANTPLKGSAAIKKVAGYTNPTWTVAGIAVTAAVSPVWTYFDMT